MDKENKDNKKILKHKIIPKPLAWIFLLILAFFLNDIINYIKTKISMGDIKLEYKIVLDIPEKTKIYFNNDNPIELNDIYIDFTLPFVFTNTKIDTIIGEAYCNKNDFLGFYKEGNIYFEASNSLKLKCLIKPNSSFSLEFDKNKWPGNLLPEKYEISYGWSKNGVDFNNELTFNQKLTTENVPSNTLKNIHVCGTKEQPITLGKIITYGCLNAKSLMDETPKNEEEEVETIIKYLRENNISTTVTKINIDGKEIDLSKYNLEEFSDKK
jgi:hypothetical protein